MPKKKKLPKTPDIALKLTLIILGAFVLVIGVIALFQTGQRTPFCANSASCIKDLSGKPSQENTGTFMGQAVQAPPVPDTPSYEIAQARQVLGATTADKHIYVDLTHQRLTAYEGNNIFMDVPISSGKWHPTPTGDFHIWIWLRATRMTGGSGGAFYDLPNVPYTMYFYNDEVAKSQGFSLHGAYWHNNFGHPMSHGCVNMRIPDAEKLFYWSNSAIQGWTTLATSDNPGPVITIYGQPPANETAFID
jgi:hypothetical protein